MENEKTTGSKIYVKEGTKEILGEATGNVYPVTLQATRTSRSTISATLAYHRGGTDQIVKKSYLYLTYTPPAPKFKEEPPPELPTFLIALFFPKGESEVLLGDMAEDFKKLAAEHSCKTAQIWYWRNSLSLVFPVAKTWARRSWPVLKTWGGRILAVAGVEEAMRRLIN